MTYKTETASIEIAPAIYDVFPDFSVYGVYVDLMSGPRALAPAIASASADAEMTASQHTENAVTEIGAVKAWRSAFADMGLKPSKYHSSVEQLVRRDRKGTLDDIGIPAVDFYNQVSLAQLSPMGAYDVDTLDDAPITVRFIDPETDRFKPLGGSPDRFPLAGSIVGYCQGDKILCWAINHRDSAETAISAETKRALIVSEGVSAETGIMAKAAIDRCKQLLEKAGLTCGPVMAVGAASQDKKG